MPLIKRYPNRKLYDTEAKRYVSLEGVAELIRRGVSVRVVDYASGEEITNLVLAQIIAEQERKQSGVVPQSLFAGLIQAGEQTFLAVRRGMTGSLELLRQVDDEIEQRVEQLVARGLIEQEAGRRITEQLHAARADDPAPSVTEPPPLPSRGDVRRLSEQLDLLAGQLDALAARIEAKE
jgi:polyhydroxyalkanoate synthesis repressor PhaR